MLTVLDAERMYAAEARELFAGENRVDPDELSAWTRYVLRPAGWAEATSPFVFDVPDDDTRAGWHEGRTGYIHLHPLLLSPWTILHEVAHWLRPRDGHGPQFCGVLLGLVQAALGDEPLYELGRAFVSNEVKWDPSSCKACERLLRSRTAHV